MLRSRARERGGDADGNVSFIAFIYSCRRSGCQGRGWEGPKTSSVGTLLRGDPAHGMPRDGLGDGDIRAPRKHTGWKPGWRTRPAGRRGGGRSERVGELGRAHQKLHVGQTAGMGRLRADDGAKGGHFMFFLTQEGLRGETEAVQRGDCWKNIPEQVGRRK